MAAKTVHKKTTRKKHKPTKKISASRPIITEAPVVESGFQQTVQVQPAKVQPEIQSKEQQPKLESQPIPSEPLQSKPQSEPAQPESVRQSPLATTSVAEQKPVQTAPVQTVTAETLEAGSSASPPSKIAPPLQNGEPEYKKSKFWIILAFVVILVLVGGGLYYFRQKVLLKSIEEKEEPTPTPSKVSATPKLEEEATDSAKLSADPSEFSIKVLNGSGIAGEAGRVRDTLEEAGFVVEDIGNADKSDYTKTIIQAKERVSKEYLDLLRDELGQKYLLDEAQELGEDEDTDVVVIIGKKEV